MEMAPACSECKVWGAALSGSSVQRVQGVGARDVRHASKQGMRDKSPQSFIKKPRCERRESELRCDHARQALRGRCQVWAGLPRQMPKSGGFVFKKDPSGAAAADAKSLEA